MHGYLRFFTPAHENEMRGYLVYVLIVKYLFHRFCSPSHSILDWTAFLCNLFFKTFLEGPVDRVICRDCIVNRRFFFFFLKRKSNSVQDILYSKINSLEHHTLTSGQITSG